MWEYNGMIYNNRYEMKKILKWSTCKWDAKYKEGKIIRIEDNNPINLINLSTYKL